MRPLLACMGIVLRAQESTPEAWARPEVARTFSALLSFTVDPRPKVRKTAQAAALEVMSVHHSARATGCAAGTSAFFCEALKATTQRDTTRLLQLTPLLRTALPLLPVGALGPVCELLLALPSAGHPRLTTAAFGIAATLAESPRARLSVKFAAQLVGALVAAAPSPDDAASSAEFAYALAAGVTRVASMERLRAGETPEVSLTFPRAPPPGDAPPVPPSVAGALVPAVAALVANFASDRIGVHHASANALAVVLTTCVDGAMVGAAAAWAAQSGSAPFLAATSATVASLPALPSTSPVLLRVLGALEGLLSLRYQHAWPTALPVLGLVLRLLGPLSHPLASRLVAGLVAVRGAVAAATDASAMAAADDEDDGFKARKRRRRNDDDDEDSDDEAAGGNGGVAGDGSAGRGAQAAAVYRVLQSLIATAIRVMGAHHFVAIVGGFCGAPSQPGAAPAAPGGGKASASAIATAGSNASAGVPDDRAWLLPLLRDNAAFAPVPLAWFTGMVLPAIRACEAAAAGATGARLPRNAKVHMTRAAQLWALLPPLMAAPPDFPSAFNAPLGKTLTTAMADGRYPELSTTVSRALETAIVRARAAAGLPPVSLAATGAAADGEEEEGGYGSDEDAGLTVAGGKTGGGKAGGKGKAAAKADGSDDEDEDDGDDDSEGDDDGRGSVGAGSVEGGATVVFGAGGVSVYAGGGDADPRHPLLASVMRPRGDKLPALSHGAGEANLAALRALARNYLPILLNLFETTVLGAAPAAAAATPAGEPAAAAIPLSANAANERSRKVLDAIAAYLSAAPAEQAAATAERLLKLLGGAAATVTSGDAAVGDAREAHRAAEAAAAKGQAGKPTSETGAALGASIKAAAAAASRMASLLTLALAVVATLPPVSAASPLTGSTLDRLYAVTVPALGDDSHPAVQKRAYRLLGAALAHHPSWALSDASRRSELVALLSASLMTVSASARRGRLQCLAPLVRGLDVGGNPAHAALIPSLLGETMLCCKDSNGKVRAAAFSLLGAMARSMAAAGEGNGLADWEEAAAAAGEGEEGEEEEEGDEEEEAMGGGKVALASALLAGNERDASGALQLDDVRLSQISGKKGKKAAHVLAPSKAALAAGEAAMAAAAAAGPEGATSSSLPPPSLTEFLRMVLGGLGASTPHMRSASLLALSRLVYDWAHTAAVHSLLPALTGTVLLLLREKSREVAKAVVGFAKVVASVAPPAELEGLVPELVTGLLAWSGESKNRIRLKIKGILTRLVRKVGWEAVAAHVPSDDAPLLAHMRKQAERKGRKKVAAQTARLEAAAGGEGGDGATAVSRARTSFRDLAGDGGDEDDSEGGGGSSSDDERGGAKSRFTAATVARSWGVAGAPRGGAASVVAPRSSRMTAVTATMRGGSNLLTSAPLPEVGAVMSDRGGFLDAKQRKIAAAARAKVAARSVMMGGGAASAVTGKTGASRAYPSSGGGGGSGGAASLLRADDDAPLDLLDGGGLSSLSAVAGSASVRALARGGKGARGRQQLAGGGATSGGLRVAADGRLVIDADASDGEGGSVGGGGGGGSDDEEAAQIRDRSKRGGPRERQRGGRGGRDRERDGGDDGELEAAVARGKGGPAAGSSGGGSGRSVVSGAASQGWGMKKSKIGAKPGSAGPNNRFSGAQFRAGGGAGGDTKTKDARFDPFAYVPLAATQMSGKHGAKAVGRFSGIMASTSQAQRSADKRRHGGGEEGGRMAGGKRKR